MTDPRHTRDPHRALTALPVTSAWWYENNNSINIYIHQANCPTLSCSISLRALKGFIHRANRAKQRKPK